MKLEMKRDGAGKLVESAEQALERLVCQALEVANTKTPKVVAVKIPSTLPGGQATKSTMNKMCLPMPAQEIMDIMEPLLSGVQDKAHRVGYKVGFEDESVNEAAKEVSAHVDANSDKGKQVLGLFVQAMQIKRNQGFINGAWQGYKDKASGTLPQFMDWKDVPKEF